MGQADDTPADGSGVANPGLRPGVPGRRHRPPSIGWMEINHEIWLSFLPVASFLVVGRFADTRFAIGAGFAAALVVFVLTRHSGVIGRLAVGGITIIGGTALVGIVIDSDKAFLASDAISDFLWMAAFGGSVLLRRPLMGTIVREMFPGAREWLPERDRVFVWLSVAWALESILTAGIRIALLDSLSADSYILWSRVATWPLNATLLGFSYYLVRRTIRGRSEAWVTEHEELDTLEA